MSDADGNFIPHVEDDQGEGVKDFYEEGDIYQEQLKRLSELKNQKTEAGKQDENLDENLEAKLKRIETDVSSIKQALGNHVLIRGQWVDIAAKDTDR